MYFSCVASFFRSPRPSEVTTEIRWAAFLPSLLVIQSCTIRNVAIVSAVEPDFAITTTCVFFGFIESSANCGEHRIDVIQHDESRVRLRLHRMRTMHRTIERPCAQSAAADSDDANRIVRPAQVFRIISDRANG